MAREYAPGTGNFFSRSIGRYKFEPNLTVPLFENLETILESAVKKPLDDEGFRGGLESIQTTLLHIESAVIHDKVNGELIMRVCNALKRAMDWAMEDIVDNCKSLNDHLSGLINLLNPYYTWSEGSVDIKILDRGLIRFLVEKESDIPRVQVVMKSNGGEDDSVVDIAGYIPPEDLNRSYGEQIKQLARTFDDSVSDDTKKTVMETLMQSSRVIRKALEEIVPAYSEVYMIVKQHTSKPFTQRKRFKRLLRLVFLIQ